MKKASAPTAIGVFFCLFTAILATAEAQNLNESFNFDDNQMPAGWTLSFTPGSPGTNAGVQNQRFEVDQIDTYAEISTPVQLPTGTTRVEVDYTGDIADVYWGMGTQIHLWNDQGYYMVGMGESGFGLEVMNVSITQQNAVYGVSQAPSDTDYVDDTFAPDYGTYNVEAIFEDGQIIDTVTKEGNSTPLYEELISVPTLTLNQVNRIGLFADTTTGDPAWIDNVNITSSTTTVPEPSTWAILAAGLGALLAFRRRRRSF